ncbi:ABC transporter permease [Mesorhizobium sp. M7A.F.Ca.US.011.01.1.1]|uniref:ABC transporter permease n=1 Tax=Mesorhizobium sp. M7A.F.Ca.US.011.01.1.1 TaxID=2496741 RepID=UPI000FCAA89E|nr:ABC transporter permease [Mesorhizobium sp. M7A.F.Ca.US.011.01.1.1]RUX29774.1 ABC transporter permease [Mesorhizobium sp. M7A.F.Ca.US.011.01.1.1]
MDRLGFLTGRAARAVLILFGVIVLNFVLLRLAPGDAASVLAGDQGAADPAFVAELRHDLGLDRSVPEQLWIYTKSLARLDFGQSYRDQRPVVDIIAERLPATLLLTLTAFGFALGIGIALGSIAARHAGSLLDAVLTGISVMFFAMPLFWTGLMAILLFSVWLNWLPSYGMQTVGEGGSDLSLVGDVAVHLILPALTLGLFYMAIYMRVTRASVLDVLDRDFVRTARAKGLKPGLIWRQHVLRNALLPIITFASLQAGQLIGGSILIETVFAWPGVGRLAFDALMQRDYNLLLAIFFITSTIVVVINLAADFLYVAADPRIEMGA